jgi:hypothetical protein
MNTGTIGTHVAPWEPLGTERRGRLGQQSSTCSCRACASWPHHLWLGQGPCGPGLMDSLWFSMIQKINDQLWPVMTSYGSIQISRFEAECHQNAIHLPYSCAGSRSRCWTRRRSIAASGIRRRGAWSNGPGTRWNTLLGLSSQCRTRWYPQSCWTLDIYMDDYYFFVMYDIF